MKDYLDEIIELDSAQDPEFAAQWSERQARKALARLRQAHNLTQAVVAERMGLPQSRIAEIERRPGNVSFARMIAYAKAIGVSIEDLARVSVTRG